MRGCLKDLGCSNSRFNDAAVEYSVTYIADASVNSMYIDVPMPGLPNVSQIMSYVMYDVARARAKEWIKNHPQPHSPLCLLGTIPAQASGLMQGLPSVNRH